MYLVACSGEFGPQFSVKFLGYHLTLSWLTEIEEVSNSNLFNLSLVEMVLILFKF